MDRSDREKTARPRDEPGSPQGTHHDLDESMLDADGINPSTRVASLPPQSPRPRPARLPTSSAPDFQERDEGDVEMTVPPSPRPPPLTIDSQVARSIEKSNANDTTNTASGSLVLLQAPSAPSPHPARALPVLPPGRIDGQNFNRARRHLKLALQLDREGKYNQALDAYDSTLTLYTPALNSMTMSSGSRKALERTLSRHHERVVELEDARVYDETEPERFMVDPSRVPPLPKANVDPRFSLPGPPASMVRPTLIGEGPAGEAEDGVDQYLLELQSIYDRSSRSRSRSRASTSVSREATPVPSVEPRDHVRSPQSAASAPGRMQPNREATPAPSVDCESSRERAGTVLPGGVENFESRHPKRGLATYGSVHGTERRRLRRKKVRTMDELDKAIRDIACQPLDLIMDHRHYRPSNPSEWMQDLYWNQHSRLHGDLAKDKYRDLRNIRERLPRWEGHLIDQEEEAGCNWVEQGWQQRRDSAMPESIRVKVCGKCGATRKPEGGPLYPCVICEDTFYCSRKCQYDHTPVHRPTCLSNARSYDDKPPRQDGARPNRQAEDRLVVLRDLSAQIDRQRSAQNEDRTEDAPSRDRTKLMKQFMSEDMDLDEYLKKAQTRTSDQRRSARGSSAFKNDSPSSPDSNMASPPSPMTPRTPGDDAVAGVGGAFDAQDTSEGLLTMRKGAPSGESQAMMRPATSRPRLVLKGPKPPNGSEHGFHNRHVDDEDANPEPDESDSSDEDVQMDWEGPPVEQSELMAQEELYPKRITEFRIVKNGGRTLEYLVSDARRDREWCSAGILLGPSW